MPMQFTMLGPVTTYPKCTVCKDECAAVGTFKATFTYVDTGAFGQGGSVTKTTTGDVNICGTCAQQIVDNVIREERKAS